MERKTNIKKMLKNVIGVRPNLKVFGYLTKLIEHIDENEGTVSGAIKTISGVKQAGNAVSQNIYLLIREMTETNKDVYEEVTGTSVPVAPREFLGFLYNYWEDNYKGVE